MDSPGADDATIDLAAATSAGIRDAAGRAELLRYLIGLGFGLEEMVEAERQGRLFALAGDAVLRSGPPRHDLRAAAELLGQSLAETTHAWAALGLPAGDPDLVQLSDADVAALHTWVAVRDALGADIALGLMRVLGASMARLAEAESAAIRAGVPDVQLDLTADEVRTAKAFAGMAGLVPRLAGLMDAVHRQHLQSARTYFEQVVADISAEVVIGIGFADLSGFTALTQRLELRELSGLLSTFGATAAEVVHEHGGRLVKLIGDAVMWVNVDSGHLAEVAWHLVDHPLAHQAGLQVRAGLAYGSALALDGDYFGTAVNLAARLVAVAEPGQVLAAAAVLDGLGDWSADPLEPVELRGIDAPVVPYTIRPARR